VSSESVRKLTEVRRRLAPLIFRADAVSEQAIERLLPLNELLNIIIDTAATEDEVLPYIAKVMGIKVEVPTQQQVPQTQQRAQSPGGCGQDIELKVELPQFFADELKKCEEVKARYNRLANELDDVVRRLAEQGIVPKNADFKVFFSPSEKVLQQLSKAERDKVEEIKKLRPQFSRCNIINGIKFLEEARVESLGKLLRGEYFPAELDKTVVESLFNDDKTLRLFENAVRSELARVANELVINDAEFMLKVLAGVRTAEVKNMHGKPGTFALLFRLGCNIAQATIDDPEVERYKTYINSICKETQDLTDRLEQDYKVEWEE
jgi:hypothetical protein